MAVWWSFAVTHSAFGSSWISVALGPLPAHYYEPGGRTFESCRAHHINNLQPLIFAQANECEQFCSRPRPECHSPDTAARNWPIF